MMKGLCWQPAQSADPSSDEVAAREKRGDQTVCLVGIAEAETPVIQVASLETGNSAPTLRRGSQRSLTFSLTS